MARRLQRKEFRRVSRPPLRRFERVWLTHRALVWQVRAAVPPACQGVRRQDGWVCLAPLQVCSLAPKLRDERQVRWQAGFESQGGEGMDLLGGANYSQEEAGRYI